MSNNIFKANFIQFSMENAKVIDTNSLVAKRLEGFSGVLREADSSLDKSDTFMEQGEFDADLMSELLADRDFSSEDESYESETYTSENVEELRSLAIAEIEEMKKTAQEEIDNLRASVYEEAKTEGYNQGMALAQAEEENKIREIEAMKEELAEEYNRMAMELEPKIVAAVSAVYLKVFGKGLFDNKDVLLSLVSRAISGVSGEKNIVLHVSPQDLPVFNQIKGFLMQKVSRDTNLVIRENESFSKGTIKLETDHGMIDCGIDTELKELSRALTLLSEEGNDV